MDLRSNIERQITALGHLSPAQLRLKYREVFGEDSRSGNKDFLIKRIPARIRQ